MSAPAGGSGAVELSIIVVSYNTQSVTLDCLRSVHEHPPQVTYELIVIDNESPDGSADVIEAAFPGLRVIRPGQNLGFAKANNVAAERARGRRLLLLNPDTVALPGSLDALWQFAEAQPDNGIWGGRTLFEDGSLNPTSCWARITPWSLFCSAVGLTHMFPNSSLFNPEAYGDWKRDSVREVDIVTGCFLLIDTALWRRLGGFDPLFFMYAEEADLCLRARGQGARPVVTPKAEIIHLGGRSELSGLEKIVKVNRGRVTLVRKHWPFGTRLIGLGLFRIWGLVRVAATLRPTAPADQKRTWRAIWQRRGEWLGGYQA